jgi:hypothetical protein
MLVCNASSSPGKNITWIKSFDKINMNTLENEEYKTEIASNGSQLILSNLTLLDQQYYGCYYSTNETTYSLISSYFLIVRSEFQKFKLLIKLIIN